MIKSKDHGNKKILALALVDVVILSCGHAYNNTVLILLALVLFSLLVLISPREIFLPIMLFYLPWSTIMKFDPNSFSFYTFIVPVFLVFILLLPRGKRIILSQGVIILTSLLVVLTMSVKLILGYSIQPSYLMFIFMLIFMPTYLRLYQSELQFKQCIIYLTFGTIAACIASKFLIGNAYMLGYISVYEWEKVGLVRFSGFIGDSNFYSLSILVGIGGLLTIVMWQKGKNNTPLLTAIITLIYFGMLSVSKMFLLVLIIIIGMWIISVLSMRSRIRKKMWVMLFLIASTMFVISSNIFLEQINYYFIRFGMVNDLDSLTTSRDVILGNYIVYLLENPIVLLLGKGYTNVLPSFTSSARFPSAAHNSIVQIVYQFGLVGTPFIIGWFVELGNTMKTRKNAYQSAAKKYSMILFAVSCFMPWLALDIIFFDHFFYISMLFYVGKKYIISQNDMFNKPPIKDGNGFI